MAEAVTQAKLIDVAIDLFGRSGRDAVTTRMIAEAARAQQSAISYHFGTKDELYLACARHIAATMRERLGPLLAAMPPPDDAAAARGQIEALLGGLVTLMMRDDIAAIARFVVREQMAPTPAFGVLYDGAMQHVVAALASRIDIIAHGALARDEIRVRAIALLGQAFIFRLGRAALERATRWDTIGEREADLVQRTVVAHARAVLADLERPGPGQPKGAHNGGHI